MKGDDYPVIGFKDSKEFEDYLEENGEREPGIWLKLAKKNSGVESITHDAAIEVVLCFGWIDGQAKGFDEKYHLLRLTPRGAKSTWSARNVGIVERLIKEGRMRKSGLEKVEAAKADGRWANAYGGSKDLVIPEDFLKEVKKDEKSYEFFQTLNKTNLFAIYFRLKTAVKPETRERRMKVILEMMKKGEKLN